MHRIDHETELTARQIADYLLFAGPRTALPRTVAEFNARLRAQADFLESGGSPDERLAAMLAREAIIA